MNVEYNNNNNVYVFNELAKLQTPFEGEQRRIHRDPCSMHGQTYFDL